MPILTGHHVAFVSSPGTSCAASIAIHGLHPVRQEALHADLMPSSVIIDLSPSSKDPLIEGAQSWYYPFAHQTDLHLLNEAAHLLLDYTNSYVLPGQHRCRTDTSADPSRSGSATEQAHS